MAFIDLCYLFMAFKLIELSESDVFSFICKDGLDTSPAFSSGFFALYYLLKPNSQQLDFNAFLELQLFAPALIWRERAILSERFQRMVALLRVLETCRNELGVDSFINAMQTAFADLYDWQWLEGQMTWPTA
jgi:hypothetical protein